jgi:hypothetical protein
MKKNSFEYLLLKVYLIVSFLGILIFLILITLNTSLILGWTISALVGLINYFLTLIFFNNLKNKFQGFFLGIFRFYLNAIIQIVFFVFIIIVNRRWNGYKIFEGSISTIYAPINIFTYLSGISIMWISIFISHSIYKKERIKCQN